MLPLLLITVGIGYYFFDLAAKSGKNKWLFGISAGVLFFLLQFVIGFVLISVASLLKQDLPSDTVLSMLTILIDSVITYLIYNYLKKSWERG